MKIIPTPQSITETGGFLSLDTILNISVAPGSDKRVVKLAATLKSEMEAITGGFVKFTVAPIATGALSVCHGENGEGYRLTVTKTGIQVEGDGPAGAYYGLQTLRQMLHEYKDQLPCCHIDDAPEFSERGFYHDVTRGRVPTLNCLYQIVDDLSYFKINALQLYVEDAYAFEEYEGIMGKEEVLTAQEILALDDYCYEHFIELVPSLSTFGHLYNLLQSDRWKHLCEFENYKPQAHYWMEKMEHHTIDVSNEESIRVICSMIDQFIPLFRSGKFNICCDETFDLCKGKNAGKNAGEEYFNFLLKIIRHVKSHGKTVMMWNDIALQHPEKIPTIPDDTIQLNWMYSAKPKEERVEALYKAGVKQIVCPGTTTWNHFIEIIDTSESNITKLAAMGKKYGALGILNTNWGDYGNLASWNCSLYGMVLGAEKGWRPDSPLPEDFESSASSLLYNSDDVNVIELIRTLGRCDNTCPWGILVYWDSISTRDGDKAALKFDIDQVRENVDITANIQKTLESLAESSPRFADLIMACRGIRLINCIVLRLRKKPDYQQLTETETFLEDYKSAWLRQSKYTRFDLVEEFIRGLATTEKRSLEPEEG